MAASKPFSETCSKGFYMATGKLSHSAIMAMAQASEEKNQQERARLNQRAAAYRNSQ